MIGSYTSSYSVRKNRIFIDLGQSPDAHKVSLLRLTARALRLVTMHLMKHGLERLLQSLVLRALVELAHEVAADLERLIAKVEGGTAEILAITHGGDQ